MAQILMKNEIIKKKGVNKYFTVTSMSLQSPSHFHWLYTEEWEEPLSPHYIRWNRFLWARCLLVSSAGQKSEPLPLPQG